ncbi:MAG: hypothetical protein FJZ00_03760 [Candidatus Sericytochromatia bacterium]|uniref:Uncharacterized protein n=1 Tax=Candidatus Tanganyikabacteria bacterium TaxID=2961651 RepID=A0A937X2U1_9BACT|nr:hypothetical protein [Candidatus Tanganyikabacteria bacterium]
MNRSSVKRAGRHVVVPILALLAALGVMGTGTPAAAQTGQTGPSDPVSGQYREEIATLYAVFPGYGMGHFLSGDSEGGMRFLALDLAATAVWMIGPSIVALAEGSAAAPGMAPMAPTAPSAVATSVFAAGLLAQSGLKVWEVWSARQASREVPKEAAVARATVK